MAAKHAHQRPFADFKSGCDIKIWGQLLNSVIILSCMQKIKFRTFQTQQNTPKITCTNTRVKTIAYMPTLPYYPGVSRIQHQSPCLPYGSPYLPDKIIFRAFLCLSLRFSPFLVQNLNFSYT